MKRPMKHSGVPWLGDVPAEWEVVRVGRILTEINRRSDLGTEEPLSMSQKYGIVPSKMIDVANPASSFIGAKIVSPGDIVLNKLKAHLGVFAISKFKGLVSPDYAVYRANEGVSAEYYNYVFHSPRCISEFRRRITGVAVGFNRLYTSDLFKIEVPFPPLTEQRRIAAFLDGVVAKIDGIRDGIQREIERLGDYRKSLVAEAVTGKRNSDSSDSLANARQKRNVSGASDKSEFEKRPMKPSGIPWLGNIPAHWELFRLKYLFTGYKAGPFGSSLITNALLEDGSILVYTPEHVAEQRTSIPNNLYLPENRRNELKKFFVKKGDVIFPIVGSLGRAMIIEEAMPEGIINQRLAMFSIRKEFLDTDYFMWVFGKSKFYESYIKNVQRGSFIVNLTKTLVGDMPFVLPPINEQKEISIFITNKTTEILSSISCIEKQIGLLQERKQIIINDIVTGKVKVI